MSAVASVDKDYIRDDHHGAALASITPSPHVLEAAEQRRWLIWFGLPALVAALFVGLVFGTGQEWYLGFAVAAIVADIGVLIWLTLSSDTNGALAAAGSHH